MIILSCNNISKSFAETSILKNISFSIRKGEKVGLIGMNGTGKTTLLKILSKQLPYDEGYIHFSKDAVIGYLKQDSIFQTQNTIYDEAVSVFANLIKDELRLRSLEIAIAKQSQISKNAHEIEKIMDDYTALTDKFERNDGYSFRSKVRGVLNGLGFSSADLDQPVNQLSGGEKTRLSLAKLLLSKPSVLLLDEPTNHLDIQAVEWLEGYMRDYQGTVIIVSHDRYFLDQLVTSILELENNSISNYNGNYSNYIAEKQIRQEQEAREFSKYKKESDRQKDIIRRLRQHGTEKLMNRAKSKEKQLSKLKVHELPTYSPKKAYMHIEARETSGKNVLQIENLSKKFGCSTLFNDVSLKIYRGDKVSLIGPNGVGKTTLFKMLLDQTNSNSNCISLGHNVVVGYYDQDQKTLTNKNSILNEIWDLYPGKTETEIRTLLGSFLFTGDDVFKTVSVLSGGEKARLSLLKLILSKSNFLLLDEPTNHLDINSKEVLEEALIKYNGTIFMISHDRYFINRVSTKILELKKKGIDQYLGNYDYYMEKKKEASLSKLNENDGQINKTQEKERRKKEKENNIRIRKIKKESDNLENNIALLEEEHSKLESLLCQEEIYSNANKSREMLCEITTIKEKLELMYSKWEKSIE
ncbi:MAG: ABC-F family ATP-binding cassette domain-containing protein [Clostridiales bacterium]|nr:ABC-F family ATP-binding cassette domain-containing protein [Clostridiales bacterium]